MRITSWKFILAEDYEKDIEEIVRAGYRVRQGTLTPIPPKPKQGNNKRINYFIRRTELGEGK